MATSQSVTLTPATETDTAQALIVPGRHRLTPATETDAAIAPTINKALTLTSATEADSAQALARGKALSLTSATTANAAAEVAAGSLRIYSVGIDTFTITHVNSATASRTFSYVIVG